MASENSAAKKVQHLIDELNSNQLEKQIEAVQGMRAHGNEHVIEPVLRVWQKTKSKELRAEIEDMLNTIKSTSVPATIIKCLQNPEFENHKIILLTSIWSSGLDYKKYVAELVQLAIEGDVQEIFEIETILDNFEFIPADDVLNEALLILGNYLNEHKENSTKNDMLIQLGVILKRMNDD